MSAINIIILTGQQLFSAFTNVFVKILNYNVTLITKQANNSTMEMTKDRTFPGFPGLCGNPALYENQIHWVIWTTLQEQFVSHQSKFQILRVPLFIHHIEPDNSGCLCCMSHLLHSGLGSRHLGCGHNSLGFLSRYSFLTCSKNTHVGLGWSRYDTKQQLNQDYSVFLQLIMSVSIQQFEFICLKILSRS